MIFDPDKLLLLAGPCSLESMDTCQPVAECLVELKRANPELNIVFKEVANFLADFCLGFVGQLGHYRET